MPTLTDWLMVIITLAYVIATILICVFNFRSAKATREQVAEAKRQYEETNRAYVTCEFIFEKRSVYGVRFTNHGKRVANNIQVQLAQEFIGSITELDFSKAIKMLDKKEFILGIGQSYDIYIGSYKYRQNPNILPVEGILTYKDDKITYEEAFYIDIEHYATIFSLNSETEDLLDAIKKQTIELAYIKKELRRIAPSAFLEYLDESEEG